MKALQHSFIGRGEVKGFEFTQVKQSPKAYIYKIDTGYSNHYEVFKKKSKTNSTRHCYPSAKAFGSWAWTCKSLAKAICRFNQLNSAGK